jgi:hypothetical protein
MGQRSLIGMPAVALLTNKTTRDRIETSTRRLPKQTLPEPVAPLVPELVRAT